MSCNGTKPIGRGRSPAREHAMHLVTERTVCGLLDVQQLRGIETLLSSGPGNGVDLHNVLMRF